MSTAEQMFIVDLRRTLYLSQVYRDALKFMRDGALCPTYLKNDIDFIEKSIARMFKHMRAKTSPETYAAVMRELSSEELKDVSLLIDFAASINNVGALVEVLQEQLNVQENGTI